MNDTLSRIFSLQRLDPSDPGVRFALTTDPPAWAWALIVLAAAAAAWWSYRKLDGPPWARGVLAGLRWALLLALALAACGPRLVQQDQRTEKDWVVALVDRSASLTVADAGEGAPGRSRDAQLREALAGSAPVWASLAADRNLLWMGFDAGAFDLPSDPTGVPALAEPEGRSTDLAQALDQALRRVAARPVAGVVIFSDGRSARPVDRATLRRLASERIPVFSVPLGSPTVPADVAVETAEAPTSAFTGDTVPVTALVRVRGRRAGPVTVRLLDGAGNVVDERPLPDAPADPDAEAQADPEAGQALRVTLTATPRGAGAERWTVEARSQAPDVTPENDRVVVPIELVDRPIRVVYFDGSPRWEYRYLKNLLLRESTIRSTALLVAPERRYLQEGNEPLLSIPRTAPDWAVFDVVIMGDVRPELFSREQLEALREVVLRRGVGLLWVGGAQSTPGRWAGTPLADLLPFSLAAADAGDGSARGFAPWPQPVLVRRTQAAERLALLQMGGAAGEPWPDELSDPSLGWPPLRWAQRIDPAIVKPTAEPLATARPGAEEGAPEAPLVLTMRYGAGRVVYVGTDEVWRWRFGRGETLPERFYLPLIRLLARESLGRLGKPVLIEVSPSPAVVDRPVRVVVTLLDESLLTSNPRGLTVRFDRRPNPNQPTGQPAGQPADAAGSFSLTLTRVGESRPGDAGAAARFEGALVPSEPGSFTIRPTDAFLAEALAAMPDQPAPEATLDVLPPDDELRFSRADHALLASLAEATGGRVLSPAARGEGPALADLPSLLPNRELRLLGAERQETLWDKPFTLALLITLLALEWVGRRLLRLV